MGSCKPHHRAMRSALASGAVVVAVDYALSPEARFPVALEQSLVIDCPERWRRSVRSARVALGGDSAGANPRCRPASTR